MADPKYIIQGVGVQVVSTGIYKSGVAAVQARGSFAGRDRPLYNSSLGTPVFGDIVVDPFNYTVDGVTYYVPGIKMYTLTMEGSGNKNLVITPIQGLNTTVKEYIGNGDEVIVISGFIDGENGIYPFNEVNDLKKLIDAPVAFKIVSRWLQNLNIDTLVIQSYELPQMPGGYSYQEFKLFCLSDIPVELNIISTSNTTAQ